VNTESRSGREFLRASRITVLAISFALAACGPIVTKISPFVLKTRAAEPGAIACCDDLGDAWFTEIKANKIGRLAADGRITEYKIPTPNCGPGDITIVLGSGGTATYFSETTGNKIGRISSSGVIKEYAVPTARSGPEGIVGDTDFNGVWFTEFAANKIGHLNSTGHFSEYNIPTLQSGPLRIAASITGNPFQNVGRAAEAYWFTEALADKIGKITRNGLITEYSLQAHSYPFGVGAQYSYAEIGSVWFTEFKRRRVGVLSPSGAVSEIEVPEGSPTELAIGEEGTVWFLESVREGSQVSVTTFSESTWMQSRRIVRVAIPIPAKIGGIASFGNDLWYTDQRSNRVIKIAVYIPSSNF